MNLVRRVFGCFILYSTSICLVLFILLPSFAWSAPQISIQTPSSNETIDGKDVFLLSGELHDLRGLQSLKIFINDLPLGEHTTRGIVVTGKDKFGLIGKVVA